MAVFLVDILVPSCRIGVLLFVAKVEGARVYDPETF